jgi:hypothetical protein
VVLVAAAEPPDGGAVAAVLVGHPADALPVGDRQDDARALDLGEGGDVAARQRLEDREVRGGEGEGTGLAATHGKPPAQG